ncbi:hypothetical protein BJX96DRAFT_157611 [Aspergillus floccosus]
MPDIQMLNRNIAILYCPSIHCTSLEELQQTCKKGNDGRLSGLLPPQITTTEILKLIHAAATIQRIACICRDTMLQNYISSVSKSRDPVASQRPARPLV